MYSSVNNSSDAISRDIKHPTADGDFISLNPYSHYQNQSSLLRYNRSTPTSFFSNLLNDNNVVGDDDLSQQRNKFESDRRSKFLPVKMDDSRRVPENDGGYGYTNQSNFYCASSSNLINQLNTTPAAILSVENGFGSMNNGSSSSTLKNHVSFSLGTSPSPSTFIPQNKNELQDYTFSNLKRSRDVLKMPQNGETRNHTPTLIHHMSLPKTSSEMAIVEKFLHFQQQSTVPWKTRAKRGCATHPRSIAERVRRTRISERIKRLQELFPDMDKQSTTSDMLDVAVEHIKNLQKELQTLNDARARCKCSSKQLLST
ncbi:hypothetical protein QVD17_33404 [Tagetes erecta]|uniref:BHLH domain-containing protein n=1 Tax=Tagetes erecta TaxID=13708 RepID=A0AAD8JXD5_TARER|nr:hypothetical protein QVD17_33404 [Tagetes erecta]